jgi:hypothetical protein
MLSAKDRRCSTVRGHRHNAMSLAPLSSSTNFTVVYGAPPTRDRTPRSTAAVLC